MKLMCVTNAKKNMAKCMLLSKRLVDQCPSLTPAKSFHQVKSDMVDRLSSHPIVFSSDKPLLSTINVDRLTITLLKQFDNQIFNQI